ncbi:MAG TPA: helix-turn-helix transcriptional regulator [Gemmatimonadaceae bacterium]
MAAATQLVQAAMTPLRVEIRTLREGRGWSQGELATRARVTRATVNRLENGRPRSIDLEVLEKLAAALGVSPPGLLIVRDESVSKRRGK